MTGAARLVVARGTVVTPHGVARPGEPVDLPADEAARLVAAGFLKWAAPPKKDGAVKPAAKGRAARNGDAA